MLVDICCLLFCCLLHANAALLVKKEKEGLEGKEEDAMLFAISLLLSKDAICLKWVCRRQLSRNVEEMLAMLLWNIYNGMLGCSDARLIAAVDDADVDVDVNVVNVAIVIVVVVVVVVVVNPRDICCVLFLPPRVSVLCCCRYNVAAICCFKLRWLVLLETYVNVVRASEIAIM